MVKKDDLEITEADWKKRISEGKKRKKHICIYPAPLCQCTPLWEISKSKLNGCVVILHLLCGFAVMR